MVDSSLASLTCSHCIVFCSNPGDIVIGAFDDEFTSCVTVAVVVNGITLLPCAMPRRVVTFQFWLIKYDKVSPTLEKNPQNEKYKKIPKYDTDKNRAMISSIKSQTWWSFISSNMLYKRLK
jgi:hypothetical protein